MVAHDRWLPRALRRRTARASARFVQAHYARIHRFLVHLSGEVHLADDLAQETFLSAWASLDSFRNEASIATWLHRIAYGKFVDSRRKAKCDKAATTERFLNQPSPGSAVPGPLERIIDNERSFGIYLAVQSLDEAARAVITLHYFQGMTFREMATVLDEPVGTVKWRTSEALTRLKTSLDQEV